MPTIVPDSTPRLSAQRLNALIEPFGINRSLEPLVVVGIRGYYKDSMGMPGVNDRGIYDDAILIDTPSATIAYNGNTDPTKYRRGHGTAESTKGMASLRTGLWRVHRFDKHKKKYLALCQRAGVVTVIRDGTEPYLDTGMFGINIHRGGFASTSSEGCQTIHPNQWDSFISTAIDQAKRYFDADWDKVVVPYALIDAP